MIAFTTRRSCRLFLSLVAVMVVSFDAAAAGLVQKPGESPSTFAIRALNIPSDADMHVTAADWNGRSDLFVDYVSGNDRDVVVLEKVVDRSYRKIDVTTGEEEGGTATVEAIGFAPSKKDNTQKLIVFLSWPVQHADVNGTLYEVRIFDAAKT